MTTPKPDWLAKDSLDVGVFTNALEPMQDFWRGTAGLTFDHMLPLGGGVRQHRHELEGAVFKLNHSRHDLPPPMAGGYLRLCIARDGLTAPIEHTDPDGNALLLVPMGHQGISHWAMEVAAPSDAAFMGFYHDALGLPRAPANPQAVQCGRSLIIPRIDPDLGHIRAPDEMARHGFRYITLQVDKVDAAHARVLAAGGAEGRAPVTLGKTARISFVRDHCGNWIELSQRASITGSLTP